MPYCGDEDRFFLPFFVEDELDVMSLPMPVPDDAAALGSLDGVAIIADGSLVELDGADISVEGDVVGEVAVDDGDEVDDDGEVCAIAPVATASAAAVSRKVFIRGSPINHLPTRAVLHPFPD